MTSIIVHYKELALKGKNRPWFIQLLVRNLRTALAGLHVASVRSSMGRIELELRPDSPHEEVRERLSRVFGIANFSFANHGPQDFTRLAATIIEEMGDIHPASFRVSATRSDKRLPFTSPQVEREIGRLIWVAKQWKVDLSHPALTIHIEMMPSEAFYFLGKEPGAGGLPSGTGGRVACLLSGGIDSPVAAWRLIKRGCRAVFIHFHGHPFVTRASADKAEELAKHLTRHQYHSRLYLVPFGDIQRQIVLSSPAPLRVVLYRRLMVRIAEEIGRENKCWALVTGDSLGQVASQTAGNITVVDEVATLPFLRPLIGMDKVEITEQAQKIGTYETSIEPDQDCCRLFIPPHPATQAKLEDVRRAESMLDVHGLVKQALEKVELKEFTFPE